MSFFSELGAGIRIAAKEYNEIKSEFVTIKDDVTSGVKSVADEATQIANGAQKAVTDNVSSVTGVVQNLPTDAKKVIGGKINIQ